MRSITRAPCLLAVLLSGACGSPPAATAPCPASGPAVLAPPTTGSSDVRTEAAAFLDFYNGVLGSLTARDQEAQWLASTDVSPLHQGGRVGADSTLAGFVGSAYVIRKEQSFLTRTSDLDELTVRQLRYALLDAAGSPALDPDLLLRRTNAEAKQAATQDAFVYCLRRQGDKCTKSTDANGIDDRLRDSHDVGERLAVWNASKEIGVPLRAGILELRDLRNATARELGYSDFFVLKAAGYGMTTAEMMALLDSALADTRPLFSQLQCYARRKLAARFKQPEPKLIPAHWIANRWAQEWPGLVPAAEGVDEAFKKKPPEWFVQQAERYYVSMGFPPLPKSFWDKSDLYPVKVGEARHKNSHATAWHMDLDHDVRSLMSVEPTHEWFGTTHHELGHIYYDLSYSTLAVPPLLRRGANPAYHEGIGELIAMSVDQEPYLRQLGLLGESKPDPTQMLLAESLERGPVFLAFAAGTMAHFEHDLYATALSAGELNARWWQYVARFQGVAPPEPRGEHYCDACSKTHINDDPGEYFDYALAALLQFQLHERLCRDFVHADVHACTYAGNKDVGDELRKILSPGASKDWKKVLREETGEDLSAKAMLRYYAPLVDYLKKENAADACGF